MRAPETPLEFMLAAMRGLNQPKQFRAAVLRDPTRSTGTAMFAVIQAAAPSLRVEVNPVNMRDAGEIERAVAAFARSPNGGLIVTPGPAGTLYLNLIITLATNAPKLPPAA